MGTAVTKGLATGVGVLLFLPVAFVPALLPNPRAWDLVEAQTAIARAAVEEFPTTDSIIHFEHQAQDSGLVHATGLAIQYVEVESPPPLHQWAGNLI